MPAVNLISMHKGAIHPRQYSFPQSVTNSISLTKGAIELEAVDTPTLYNTMRASRGAVEPQFSGRTYATHRTNRAYWSTDPSSAWIPILKGGAMVQNAAIAPNGELEASEFFGDEGGGVDGQVRHAEGIATANIRGNQYYVVSLYVKNSQGNDWLLFSNSSYTNIIYRSANYFNITTGVAGVNNPSGTSGIEPATLSIPGAPDGWFRIWKILMFDPSDLVGNMDLYQRSGDTGPTGARDDNSYYFWGFQFEPGYDGLDSRPTPLIVTTTTTADATTAASGMVNEFRADRGAIEQPGTYWAAGGGARGFGWPLGLIDELPHN